MNGDAVEKITQLAQMDAKDSIIQERDQSFSTRKLFRIEEFCPKIAPVGVGTLGGFVDFIYHNLDAIVYNEYFVHVENHKRVSLCSKPLGEARLREFPVIAELDPKLKQFPFEQYQDAETFIINLRSLFQQSIDVERLIAYTAKVNVDEGIKTEDDGITQTVQMKRGISGSLEETQSAPVIVDLMPWRTFREVEQPESQFLFRMKQDRSGVVCALFEADGGTWRIAAVEEIRSKLAGLLPEDLPIFA